MNRSSTTIADCDSWFASITATVSRCHMLGVAASLILTFAIGWAWSCNARSVTEIACGETIVNLRDAKELILNANQWRRRYTASYTVSQETDQRVESIAAWIPRSVDWDSTEQSIRSIGARAELKILAIKKGDRHIGTRVGIVSATCKVEGTYQSLCEFLSQLSEQPHPIACSELNLHRISPKERRPPESTEARCAAVLSLRIPFAASGTAAGRLLPTETKNES